MKVLQNMLDVCENPSSRGPAEIHLPGSNGGIKERFEQRAAA